MRMTVEVSVDKHRLALPLTVVAQVARAAMVTPLPDAPALLLGVIDFHGELIPVLDIRVRLGLESRPLRLSDLLVVLRTPSRCLAIVVDGVIGITEWEERDFVPARTLAAESGVFEGVARGGEGLLVIVDPDAFLGQKERAVLDEALADHE
ncbi:MAG: chemotaxis protein CheW [Rhodocyclales bacterium]|nr:chemotaxis protein CheW [Rhodocyclales bacterium]